MFPICFLNPSSLVRSRCKWTFARCFFFLQTNKSFYRSRFIQFIFFRFNYFFMGVFFYIFLSCFLCGLKDRLLMIICTFLLRFRSDITSCLFFSTYLIGLIATFFYRLISLIRWLNPFRLTRVKSRRKGRCFSLSCFFLFGRMIFFRRLCSIL